MKVLLVRDFSTLALLAIVFNIPALLVRRFNFLVVLAKDFSIMEHLAIAFNILLLEQAELILVVMEPEVFVIRMVLEVLAKDHSVPVLVNQ